MAAPDFITIAEQVAAYLRGELLRERWSGTMPGMNHLAPELGVNAKTVEVALKLLVKEGCLLHTSDADDDLHRLYLGRRGII